MGREIARLKHASMLTGCRPCFGEKSQGTQTYVFAERQHFEGLEGNEIAGHSNEFADVLTMFCGLEEDKITGLSIKLSLTGAECIKALEVEEITGYSNSCCYQSTRFGEEKATWYSNRLSSC